MTSSNKPRDEVQVRSQKVNELRELGIDCYPSNCVSSTHTAQGVKVLFNDTKNYVDGINLSNSESDPNKTPLILSGRITFKRDGGNISFMGLTDSSGTIQLKLEKNLVMVGGNQNLSYAQAKKYLDVGDFINVEGIGCRTDKGQLSVLVNSILIVSKALMPFPSAHYGIIDKELCRRHRELDLVSNPESLKTFKIRSQVIKEIRTYLWYEGFEELETSVLQGLYGGANANPFITHHNALDTNLYLRIAPELHLKRAICGGFEKVFEIGKVFRNEGIDTTHNPEFTSLEIYQAYTDYFKVMSLIESLIHSIHVECAYKENLVHYGQVLNEWNYQGKVIDLELKYDYSQEYPSLKGKHWKVQTMIEAVKEHTGLDFGVLTLKETLGITEQRGYYNLSDLDKQSLGYLLYKVFDTYVVPKLIQPTFIIDFPVEVSPLAKLHRTKLGFVERFELYIHGVEYANGFSELNDPKEQRERFESQLAQRLKGDGEAHLMDEDYIQALSLGMPNCGGVGLGIDRLVMLFTNTSSIRDVIMFPTMKVVD